jgi:hypothetical protein
MIVAMSQRVAQHKLVVANGKTTNYASWVDARTLWTINQICGVRSKLLKIPQRDLVQWTIRPTLFDGINVFPVSLRIFVSFVFFFVIVCVLHRPSESIWRSFSLLISFRRVISDTGNPIITEKKISSDHWMIGTLIYTFPKGCQFSEKGVRNTSKMCQTPNGFSVVLAESFLLTNLYFVIIFGLKIATMWQIWNVS